MARKPKTRAPYRMVSPPTWELARAAYLGGKTAAEVAAQFNIGLHNLRQNIHQHGWSKRALADARAALQADAAAGDPPPADPMAAARAAAAPPRPRTHPNPGATCWPGSCAGPGRRCSPAAAARPRPC